MPSGFYSRTFCAKQPSCICLSFLLTLLHLIAVRMLAPFHAVALRARYRLTIVDSAVARLLILFVD